MGKGRWGKSQVLEGRDRPITGLVKAQRLWWTRGKKMLKRTEVERRKEIRSYFDYCVQDVDEKK